MDRFYTVLVPFLTGKPLEQSLILAEENDGVVGVFLKEAPDAAPVRLKVPEALKNQPVHVVRRPHGGLVCFPSSTHQGGFVAILRRAPSDL